MRCVSCLVSDLVSCASLVLSFIFACLMHYVSHLIFGLVSCTSLGLSLTLYLLRCISRLVFCPLTFCSRLSTVNLLVFSLYIISFDKQSYVELAVNQYRYLVWHHQVSCALRLCFLSCALRLSCLLLRLLPYLLLGFHSRCEL